MVNKNFMNSSRVFYIYVQKQSLNKMEKEFSLIYGYIKHFEFHILNIYQFQGMRKNHFLNNDLPFE
jgi:hypothetical protein